MREIGEVMKQYVLAPSRIPMLLRIDILSLFQIDIFILYALSAVNNVNTGLEGEYLVCLVVYNRS